MRIVSQRLVLILVNDSPVGVNDTLADAILGIQFSYEFSQTKEVWYGGQEAGNAGKFPQIKFDFV